MTGGLKQHAVLKYPKKNINERTRGVKFAEKRNMKIISTMSMCLTSSQSLTSSVT